MRLETIDSERAIPSAVLHALARLTAGATYHLDPCLAIPCERNTRLQRIGHDGAFGHGDIFVMSHLDIQIPEGIPYLLNVSCSSQH